jgi:hypothetical protein
MQRLRPISPEAAFSPCKAAAGVGAGAAAAAASEPDLLQQDCAHCRARACNCGSYLGGTVVEWHSSGQKDGVFHLVWGSVVPHLAGLDRVRVEGRLWDVGFGSRECSCCCLEGDLGASALYSIRQGCSYGVRQGSLGSWFHSWLVAFAG